MNENTKTTTPTTLADTSIDDTRVNHYILQDLRASLLITSLVVNLVILTAWIALQVTSSYDTAVIGLLFNR